MGTISDTFVPFDERSPESIEERLRSYAVPLGSRCRCAACISDPHFAFEERRLEEAQRAH